MGAGQRAGQGNGRGEPSGVHLPLCVCRAKWPGHFVKVQSAFADTDGARRRLIHVVLTTFHIFTAKHYL